MEKNHQCEYCGKNFKRAYDLKRHHERYPCVNKNPSNNFDVKCIYCKYDMATKQSLEIHFASCRVRKNLDEKSIAAIQEAEERRKKDLESEKEMKILKEKVKCLEQIIQNNKTGDTYNINNSTNINSTNIDNSINTTNVNVTQHIHINNYDSPNLDGLKFTTEELNGLTNINSLYDLAVSKIYFNKERPENHSVYPIDSKTVIAYCNGWEIYKGKNSHNVLVGCCKISDNHIAMNIGCLSDEYYESLQNNGRDVIQGFNMNVLNKWGTLTEEEKYPTGLFLETASRLKGDVKPQIVNSGCKLLA